MILSSQHEIFYAKPYVYYVYIVRDFLVDVRLILVHLMVLTTQIRMKISVIKWTKLEGAY